MKIEKLPQEIVDTIIAYRRQGLNSEEIGLLVDKSPGAVSRQLLKAMRRDPSLRIHRERINEETAEKLREAIGRLDALNGKMGYPFTWDIYAQAIQDAGILGQEEDGTNRIPTKSQISHFRSPEATEAMKAAQVNRRPKRRAL